jgi:hypothetical protein
MKPFNTTVRAVAVALALAYAGAAVAQQAAPTPKPAAKPKAKAPEMVREARAMEILKATSARLAAARSMSFVATATYEYPSQLGPAIAYTTRTEVLMQRPDKLRVVTVADGPASEFYYDGKVMMAYAPAEHMVAVSEAPPTVDAALKAAYERAAIYFPFTDLVLADPYAALSEGVKLAFFVGQSKVVGGVVTDMVVFATDDVFIQAWIGAEDKLPRRLRAVYRADPQRLRHQVDLSDWKLDAAVPAGAFASEKAASAPKMAFAKPEIPKLPPNMKPPALKSKPAPKS